MNKKTRSLNVAMTVAIIASEALRQNNFYLNIMINSDFRKKMADSWFSYLQSQICKEFEYLEENKKKFIKRDMEEKKKK